MKYVLDTDTISALMRRPSPAFVRRVQQAADSELSTTSINLGELLFGALRLGSEGRNRRETIEREVVGRFPILPFDEAASRVYARIRADLESAGTPIGEADTRIAAITLHHNLTVVTANVRHFGRVHGLRIENWIPSMS